MGTSGEQDVTFGLLGELWVARSGGSLALGGRQQRAVLGMLLVEANTAVSRDRLADGLWGQQAPAGAAATIQTYISHLRDVLEVDRPRGAAGRLLVTAPGGYRLDVDLSRVDAEVFRRRVHAGRRMLDAGEVAAGAAELSAALALWRGPVLADLADYPFVAVTAARLDGLRLDAVQARVQADLALGRHRDLLGELDLLCAAHPVREELQAQRMLALYRCGRQSDALAGYQQVRHTLADELGIDPGPQLQHLYQAILAQDPTLDWHPPPAVAARIAADPVGPAATNPPDTVAAVVVAPPPARLPPADSGGQTIAAEGQPDGHGWVARAGRWWVRRRLPVTAQVAVLALAGVVALVAAHPWSRTDGPMRLAADSVGAFDRSGGRLLADVPVGSGPNGLAVGAGAVWAVNGNDGTVSRIDLGSRTVVQKIPVGADPVAVAAAGDQVWVAVSSRNAVALINTRSDTVVASIPVGDHPDAIAADSRGVWVANQASGSVTRIDPATLATRTVDVGDGPDGIAVSADAVWVTNGGDGTVTRIDPATDTVTSLVPGVGSGAAGVAATPDAVWVANSLDLTVTRIDPMTNQVSVKFTVGDGPFAVAAGAGAIWVSTINDGTLARIDPRTDQVSTVPLGASPHGVAVDGSTVWVAAQAFNSAGHRGGTLVVDVVNPADNFPVTLDPAFPDDQLGSLMYDGLLAYRRISGPAGLVLVPDLAMAVPRATDGGLTYTFQLRPGIRYSDGSTVKPADIRRGMERMLSFRWVDGQGAVEYGTYAAAYYRALKGAAACADHPVCDLSAGISIDDAAATVTFHLLVPDPDFLVKLSLENGGVVATPPVAGRSDSAATPFPGTGPYRVQTFQPGRALTLVRNPYFTRWSYAAKPDGYPDSIRWRPATDEASAIADVTAGAADFTDVKSISGHDQLAIRAPTQVHERTYGWTHYLALNTRLAPFDNLLARQAVNYAVDRRAVAAGTGGQVACQLLPPGFPGYQPDCPFTVNPTADGSWFGPDLATARALVARSGTAGARVTVWTDPYHRAAADVVTGVLDQLGYVATEHAVDSNVNYFGIVQDSRTQIQAAVAGWGEDYPAPSGFVDPLTSCAGFIAANGQDNNNIAELCNPSIDTLAAQAKQAQTTDPGLAQRLWAQVDHELSLASAVIALYNPVLTTYVSARVGNYQDSLEYGPLFDQMWVK